MYYGMKRWLLELCEHLLPLRIHMWPSQVNTIAIKFIQKVPINSYLYRFKLIRDNLLSIRLNVENRSKKKPWMPLWEVSKESSKKCHLLEIVYPQELYQKEPQRIGLSNLIRFCSLDVMNNFLPEMSIILGLRINQIGNPQKEIWVGLILNKTIKVKTIIISLFQGLLLRLLNWIELEELRK